MQSERIGGQVLIFQCGGINFIEGNVMKRIFKTTCLLSFIFLGTFFLKTGLLYANLAGNSGFEEAIGNGVAENWDSTNGATRVTTATLPGGGFGAVPQGDGALNISSNFTFQTDDTVRAGDFLTLSARAESSVPIGGGAQGGQVRIEFKRIVGAGDVLISALDSSFITSTSAAPGSGYPQFAVSGVAPEGTDRVVFVLRHQGGGVGNIIFDDVRAEIDPVKFNIRTTKSTISVGEPVGFQAVVNNPTGETFNNVSMHMELPAGFQFDEGAIQLNGQQAQVDRGSVIVRFGSIAPNQSATVGGILFATSGVTANKTYVIDVIFNNGNEISERKRLQIRVEEDSLFSQGTVIGKVFHDANQNTIQDDGEPGVPWVRLVTEEGITIITDEHGRYSIPAMSEGRHVIKLDGHSLPEGTKFITEESLLINTTEGIMNKASFAILLPESKVPKEFQEDLQVRITQGLDTSLPNLHISMEPNILKEGLGTLEQEAVFKFATNYADFIKTWEVEIRDELGRPIWNGFGVGNPPNEVTWAGQTENGEIVSPGIYSYQLKVEDAKGRQDWTPLNFFRVVSKSDSPEKISRLVEIPAVGDFNLFEDGKSSIPLVAKPTIRVNGKTKPDHIVTINTRVVPVEADGVFHAEFYVEPGEKEFIIETTSPHGVVTSYKESVTVKDSMFFMVALAEEELGQNFSSGNFGVAGDQGNDNKDFYEDGRMSYFFKGKLKGNVLVKSHYDTSAQRTALFKNLDGDEYYPVYGDNSTIDYEGQNTRQRFYFLVEMNRSFSRWGSFQTEFNDTELATYNRSLSGLQVHLEDTGTTPYGDAKKGLDVFWSDANHQNDHVEFAATGGSLYYVRHRNVIEGSEKIRVEIRDKIQNMTIESYDLFEGKDYEIDYDEGRILLSRPLSSVGATDTIISQDILNGSPIFLIVDYEYDAGHEAIETSNRGLRGYTHLGDHFKVGGTAVQEERNAGSGKDYNMRGVDATFKTGRNTKVVAEYVETQQAQNGQIISYDGGLSFRELSNLRGQNTRPRENAFLVKAESKPIEDLEVSGFIQAVEPGFSNANSRSQQGMKKYGVAAKYDLTDDLFLRYRFDSGEVVGQLLPVEQHNLAADFETKRSHLAQVVYEKEKWNAQVDYMRQVADLPQSNLNESLLSEFPFDHAIATKIGYRVDERLEPYTKFQTSFKGESNYQAGGGVRYRIAQSLFGYVEQMFGNIGDSSLIGFEKLNKDNARSYVNIRMRDQLTGGQVVSSTIGNSYALTEKSRVFSERQYSTHQSVNGYADINGLTGKLGDRWDYEARYERRHLDNPGSRALDVQASNILTRTNSFNTASGALAYNYDNRFKARTFLEARRDSDVPKVGQWVSRNSIEYKFSEDMAYLGKLDLGKSRFSDPDGSPADFMEFSTGLAYRPVDHDRFNALARYTYLRDIANDAQFDPSVFSAADLDERAHIFAVDMHYDVHKYFGLTEKLAYKRSDLSTSSSASSIIHNVLWVNRLTYHIARKWDLIGEYRMLWELDALDTVKQGALVQVDREFYDYVRLGLGYNFTHFDDDLRTTNDFDAHGPFVRMTGKF